jgi:glycosyltransferase involved in cell wall biosynthesis
MSISMLEAMARGRSVVATDVPGAREALGEEGGAIVPPEQPKLLADALVERLLDRERAGAEGRSARRRAERFHDRRVGLEAIASIYAGLLERAD